MDTMQNPITTRRNGHVIYHVHSAHSLQLTAQTEPNYVHVLYVPIIHVMYNVHVHVVVLHMRGEFPFKTLYQ